MARREVKVKVCDRHPLNQKAVPATRTIRFGFGDTQWDIDVCEQHGDMLERELYAWGRLGRSVETTSTGRMFGSEYGRDLSRLAELRTQQAQEDRAADEARRNFAAVATGSELLSRIAGPQPAAPEDAGEYVFTEHALQRLEEREVAPVAALWAASAPNTRRPARAAGLVIHERDGVKVVLNPETKAIITVAIVETEERKAI